MAVAPRRRRAVTARAMRRRAAGPSSPTPARAPMAGPKAMPTPMRASWRPACPPWPSETCMA